LYKGGKLYFMTCAIMQPTYLPWIGYFDLIRNVDVFVIYDHVQFEKQSWQQRNRIRNKTGEIMLTVPVHHDTGLQRRIKDVRIDHNRGMLRKHITSIKLAYAKARNFGTIYPELNKIYQKDHVFLKDFLMDLIRFGMEQLSIDTKILFSGDMNVDGHKVPALIEICRQLGVDNYLSPIGSKVYIEENNLFSENSIQLNYQQFAHPEYRQINYDDFISHLSFVDYLFNADPVEIKNFGSKKIFGYDA
jgi:hypothetical protein